MSSAARDSWLDRTCFVGLVATYLVWLMASAGDIGYSRDEGFYQYAADAYGRWFRLLFDDPGQALTRARVDRAFRVNHEHPVLLKSLFFFSRHFLYPDFIRPLGLSYRLPAMLLSSLAIGVTFAWGRRVAGRLAGLTAALLFALMPRVFFHSHLACFDMPVAAMWLFTLYAYSRSLESRAWGWVISSTILYGLMLNTKHNAWLLPPALAVHAIGLHALEVFRGRRRWWHVQPPRALLLMALVGPALCYATWPWMWWDTKARWLEYFNFHMKHVYYNMEYLGQTYFRPPFPRGYAWLMTAATVPLVALVLGALGAGFKAWEGCRLLRGAHPDKNPVQVGWGALWAGSIAASYAPWLLSNSTPIFGGTKHWLTAYPFIALFAGLALGRVSQYFALSRGPRLALAGSCLAAPALMTVQSHPWGLSAYTPLVGGAVGAANLGLNRTFWGYTTASVASVLNRQAKPRARVFVHDTLPGSFALMQRDGTLRRDLRMARSVADSDWALYHHEPHMSRVEHMVWTDYGTNQPAAVGAHQGVPVVWLYKRPPAKPTRAGRTNP